MTASWDPPGSAEHAVGGFRGAVIRRWLAAVSVRPLIGEDDLDDATRRVLEELDDVSER